MIDLKEIYRNPNTLKESLAKRNEPDVTQEILNLYENVRSITRETQELEANRNAIAKQIGVLVQKRNKATDENEINQISQLIDDAKENVTATKQKEADLIHKLRKSQEDLQDKLLYIPNILHESVPLGKNEDDNQEVRKYLEPTKFEFTPKTHYELLENLGGLDLSRAAKISGSRFSILKSNVSRLERALVNFMLDTHTKCHGFVEYSVPVLAHTDILVGTAQLPKFREDLFSTNDGVHWLISTGEVTLTNMFRGETLEESELPLRLVASSQCFRKEAGSRGKDTKGMLRQHQFCKIELVTFTTPEAGEEELEYITSCAERILKLLDLPYRTVLLCGGDTGFASHKTYDIEVWLPSEQRYREISSCSLCSDFQSRRMATKFKRNNKSILVNTLNGSGLAVGRTIVAIAENYQQPDGSIKVPKVLVPYMDGLEIIKN